MRTKSLKIPKEVIRRHKSMKDREHNGQKCLKIPKEFEDTKGRHKSMKDREHNGQKFEDTKVLNRRHKSMTTENTMAKSLKIPKE